MGFTAPSGWNIWKMRFEKQSEGESDMKYYSTRDAAVRMDAAEAIKMGLSRDGGLLDPLRDPADRPGFFGEPGECPVPGAGCQGHGPVPDRLHL